MKKWIFAFTIFFALFSCGGESEVEVLKKEIMAGHDEVMPKMAAVKGLELALIDLPDSVVTNKDSVLLVTQDLVNSNNWMKQWMREYNPQSEDKSYLTKELVQVEKMKTYINKSISDAEKIIRSTGR